MASKFPFALSRGVLINRKRAAALRRLSDWFPFALSRGVLINLRVVTASTYGPSFPFALSRGALINALYIGTKLAEMIVSIRFIARGADQRVQIAAGLWIACFHSLYREGC